MRGLRDHCGISVHESQKKKTRKQRNNGSTTTSKKNALLFLFSFLLLLLLLPVGRNNERAINVLVVVVVSLCVEDVNVLANLAAGHPRYVVVQPARHQKSGIANLRGANADVAMMD